MAAPTDLTQLSRVLFDSAARNWWLAWTFEFCAGVGAVALGVVHLDDSATLTGAGIVATLLILAYVVRLGSEGTYDMAETIRRQMVLSEGMDWPIAGWQRRRWVDRAGARRLRQLEIQPRDADYYATAADSGPTKLAEMTLESAFYTRFQYRKLQLAMRILSFAAALSVVVLLWVSTTDAVPDSTGTLIATAVFLAVPVLIGFDFLGWSLRLARLIQGTEEIERDLEEALKDITPEKVLRIVSEYNCLVVTGIPIANWMFSRWRDEIHHLWLLEQSSSVPSGQ